VAQGMYRGNTRSAGASRTSVWMNSDTVKWGARYVSRACSHEFTS
jgi:hypothetical protein